jgi:hypothetical protein
MSRKQIERFCMDMKLPPLKIKPLCSALIVATLLSACGGGGSNTTPSGNTNSQGAGKQPTGSAPPAGDPPAPGGGNPPAPGNTAADVPTPAPVSAPMTMSCVDGPSFQCSGDSIIRTDNGVALTRSGVQAYGRSTSDLVKPIADPTSASGLAQASGGTAEMRLAKDGNRTVSKPVLLLNNLGLSWDGNTERPLIIDAFDPSLGRTQLDANGAVKVDIPLPKSSDLGFYDYAGKGIAGTQANYANNRYFPRIDNPSRCPAPKDPKSDECTLETKGLQYRAGNWTSGGRTPDWASTGRLHGEGDVHAGDGKPDANGKPTILEGGTGFGVPFPGSKGYRGIDNWSFTYGNLGAWVTQDTVLIHEWGGTDEHTKMRRGIVAFGDVTNPSNVPTSGTASYAGIAYGWHAGSTSQDAQVFWGAATVTVNFATREVTITVENTETYNDAATKLPAASFKAVTKMGAAGESVGNYLTGPVDNGVVKGGVSGRYFGPVNGAPAEVGGAFTLAKSANGQTVIGGFIARKQ